MTDPNQKIKSNQYKSNSVRKIYEYDVQNDVEKPSVIITTEKHQTQQMNFKNQAKNDGFLSILKDE